MKLKKLALFVYRNSSIFSSLENIADLAAYCHIRYRAQFSAEMIAERFSQNIDSHVFLKVYHRVYNELISNRYVGGAVLKQLCKIDKGEVVQLVESRLRQLQAPRASALNMRKDSNLMSISGGIVSIQTSRYAKLHEDYDDR